MDVDERAKQLNREGQALVAANNPSGAQARYRQALDLLPPGAFMAAVSYDNLGSVLVNQGQLHDGIDAHRTALRILESYPEATLDIAITANNLGLAYFTLGNYSLARRYYDAARSYHDKFGQVTDHYLGTLLNIAVLDGIDDPAAGLRETESMLDGCVYFQDQTGHRSVHANKAVSVRAQLLVRTGNLDTAEPLLDQAIPILINNTGPTSPDSIALRAARADLLRQRGDPRAESELLAVLADEVAAELLVSAEQTRRQLSEYYFLHGRLREQALLLDANVGSEERRTANLLLEGSEGEALDACTYEVRHLGRFLSVVDGQHSSQPDLVAVALEHWLRRKAITREVIERFSRLADELPPSPQTQELLAVRARLDEDVRIASEHFVRPNSEWAQRQRRIVTDRARAEELERALGRSTTLSDIAILQSNIVVRLQKALDADTVLLEFCALAAHRLSDTATNEVWEHGYAVFAVTAESCGPPRYCWLGSSDRIDTLVAHTLEQIGNGRRPRDIGGSPAATGGPTRFDASVSEGLNELALTLGSLLPDTTRKVVISADSMLGALPFQILPAAAGQWIDAYELSYVVSGVDLLRPRNPDAIPGSALVLAAPQFSTHGLQTPFSDLDGARQEGLEVAALLDTTALTGADATKRSVLTAERPDILHLATHAFYEAATSMQITMSTAATVTAPDPDAQPATIANLDPADVFDLRRQLSRAGLAFAGANDADLAQRRAQGDADEDLDFGRILALDLAHLDLSETDLVVLSACDTGKGTAIIAQGLWGIPLALQAAGARCTLSSLWRIDDDSTRDLMTEFYRELARGARPAQALQTAGRKVRESRPEPRYWAPFVLIGDNRPLRRFSGLAASSGRHATGGADDGPDSDSVAAQ